MSWASCWSAKKNSSIFSIALRGFSRVEYISKRERDKERDGDSSLHECCNSSLTQKRSKCLEEWFLHMFPRTIKRTCSAHHLSQGKKQERKSNQIVLKSSEKNNVAHDIISLTVEEERESSEVGWRRAIETVVRVQSSGNLLSYCFDLLRVVVAWGMRKRERHIEEKTDSSEAFPREKIVRMRETESFIWSFFQREICAQSTREETHPEGRGNLTWRRECSNQMAQQQQQQLHYHQLRRSSNNNNNKQHPLHFCLLFSSR